MFGFIIRGQTPIRKTSADAVGSFIGRHQDVRPFVQLYGNGRNRLGGTFGAMVICPHLLLPDTERPQNTRPKVRPTSSCVKKTLH